MTAPAASEPSLVSVFLSLIITLLTPLFLAAAGGDVGLARRAARETVMCYAGRHLADWLKVAKIIAFDLATLSALSQSAQHDLSAEAMLRIQRCAVALNRSAEQNRRLLEKSLAAAETGALPAEPEPSEEDLAREEAALQARFAETRALIDRMRAEAPDQAPLAAPESRGAASASPVATTDASTLALPSAPMQQPHLEVTKSALPSGTGASAPSGIAAPNPQTPSASAAARQVAAEPGRSKSPAPAGLTSANVLPGAGQRASQSVLPGLPRGSATPGGEQWRHGWIDAYAFVAEELSSGARNLPASERARRREQAAALDGVARTLVTQPPESGK